MSRTNKSRHLRRRSGGGHHYRSRNMQFVKKVGNRRVRTVVHQRLKDVPFTDNFDEKRLPDKKADLFDSWWYGD